MPFFFYSGMDSDINLCREAKQDKNAIAEAARSKTLSEEEQKKLDAFVASIDELYHLFNREHGEPPNGINKTLHTLSVEAIDKINAGTGAQVQEKLAGLRKGLDGYKETPDFTASCIEDGLKATTGLLGVALFTYSLSLNISLGLLTFGLALGHLVFIAAAGYMLFTFAESSWHQHKLANDEQIDSICTFFDEPTPKEQQQNQAEKDEIVAVIRV